MANKHMKRCLTLLVIREMLIKAAMRCYFTPTRVAKIKNSKNNMLVRTWRHWKEPSYHWWECKMVHTWENSLLIPQDVKHRVYGPAITCTPKRNENICPHKNLCMNVHSIFIITKKWKPSKCLSAHEWVVYNGILFRHKKELSTNTSYHLCEP